MNKLLSILIIVLAVFSIGLYSQGADIAPLGNDDCLELYQGFDLIYNSCDLLGASLTTIQATDTIKDSRAVINTNFANLNTEKLDSYDVIGGTGISWASTTFTISFDCSEVEGTGINCSGENITLDATGDWTGTLDGYEGAAFFQLTTWYATTTHALLSSLPSLSITESQISDFDSDDYLSLSTWFATTTHSLISSLPALTDVGTISQLDFTHASGTLITFTTA